MKLLQPEGFQRTWESLGRQEHQCLPMCDLWNSCTWCRWVDGSGHGELVWRNGNQSALATFFFTVCDEFFEFAGKFDVKEKTSAFFLVSINLQTSYNLTTTLHNFCSMVFFVPSTGRSIPKVLWASAIAWLENANLIWRSGGFGAVHSSNRKIPNDLFEMEGIFAVVVTYRNFHRNSTMWRYDSNLYMKFHHRSHERITCLWGFLKKTLRQGGCFGWNIGHKKGLDDTNIGISHLDRLDFWGPTSRWSPVLRIDASQWSGKSFLLLQLA